MVSKHILYSLSICENLYKNLLAFIIKDYLILSIRIKYINIYHFVKLQFATKNMNCHFFNLRPVRVCRSMTRMWL